MITSRQNVLIKRYRKNSSFITVEGAKLVNEALSAGFIPEISLFSEGAFQKHKTLFGLLGGEVISDDISRYISDTDTPQGVFVKFKPRDDDASLDFSQCTQLVILDDVQDPGNVGAIARSCEAFGIDGVILSLRSADFYKQKVVRASAGSVFRVANMRGAICDIIPILKSNGFKVWATSLCEGAVPLDGIEFRERVINTPKTAKVAIVIGNEGSGVSPDTLSLCDGKVYIPISGVESLNAGVAAGIVLYTLDKRRAI